ncbi:MAG: hypothetical protein WD649_02020 [Thermoleophilaceae bacterium]
MSTLELQRFESVDAGGGMVLFRLAGRWPHHGDAADAQATLMVHSGGDTHELDALPEPGLSTDGGARNAAFAAPEPIRSDADGFELAVGGVVFDLPDCNSTVSAQAMPARRAMRSERPGPAGPRFRLPTMRMPPLPRLRLPAPGPVAARVLPRPRVEAWDLDELRVMAAGCAIGAACATALLIEIIP